MEPLSGMYDIVLLSQGMSLRQVGLTHRWRLPHVVARWNDAMSWTKISARCRN
jgi:hypothetical protein